MEEELRNKLKKLLEMGFTQKSITNRLGLSKTTISYFLKKERELGKKSEKKLIQVIEDIKEEIKII